MLGRGELAHALTVSVHGVSASAREKIEAAGGTITLIDAYGRVEWDGDLLPRQCLPDRPTSGSGSLITAFILALYRLGSWLPAPGVNPSTVRDLFNQSGTGTILGYLNLFSGQALQNLSLFALGIMPYITASIIIQLLAVVIPSLEKMQKEGEAGQRRLTQYTRYLTVALAAGQSAGYVVVFHNGSALGGSDALPDLNAARVHPDRAHADGRSTLLMWMGEYITRRGVGNGQSLLIFCSILTSIPTAISAWLNGSVFEKLSLPIVVLGVILAVVFINEGQRRIPIQYARRGATAVGQTTYMPLRVNMAGVIPVIFAAAVLLLPATIGQILNIPLAGEHVRADDLAVDPARVHPDHGVHVLLHGGAVQPGRPGRQPEEVRRLHPGHPPGPADGAVPRPRDGAPDASRRLYLGLIAVLPTIFIRYAGFSQATARALGGTSVLIVVGVALDTMRQVQSQVMMRHYEGFLK